MLLAKNKSGQSFELYISLIDNYSHHEKDVVSLFSLIISQSKRLARNEINYYQVDRKIYTIVSHLALTNKEFVKSLNPEALQQKDLSKLKEILRRSSVEQV